jgi:hypothetical protein
MSSIKKKKKKERKAIVLWRLWTSPNVPSWNLEITAYRVKRQVKN